MPRRPGEAPRKTLSGKEAQSTGQEEPALWGGVCVALHPQQPWEAPESTALSVALTVPWTPGDWPMSVHCELGEQMDSVREGQGLFAFTKKALSVHL